MSNLTYVFCPSRTKSARVTNVAQSLTQAISPASPSAALAHGTFCNWLACVLRPQACVVPVLLRHASQPLLGREACDALIVFGGTLDVRLKPIAAPIGYFSLASPRLISMNDTLAVDTEAFFFCSLVFLWVWFSL